MPDRYNDDLDKDYRFVDYPKEMFETLRPFTDHLPKEEKEMAARRVIRYLELVIEQVDEEMEVEEMVRLEKLE